MNLVIGLTGGIASGKSVVHKLFESLGVPVLEADDVGRDVVAVGEPALAEIAAAFGAQMLQADGSLNRSKMREKVFGNPAALVELERITHPYIRTKIQQWINAQTAPYCILSAAILIEKGLSKFTQRILVVDTTEQEQLNRLMQRDGISLELAQLMMSRQLSRAERLNYADDVIDNAPPARELLPNVQQLHEMYLALAKV